MILLLAGVAALGAKAGPNLALAYHGHGLTHPGATVRLAWRPSDRRVAFQPEVEGGGWVHPRHQLALFVRGGIALSHHGRRGGRHGLFAHVGPQRSTWTVPTFAVGDGDVSRRPLSGQWWLTGTAGVTLGRKSWFVRPQLSLRGPHFHGLASDVAVQVGALLGGAK
ncbi:MAG: hypothetical protein AAGA48_26520 [Myxococcota bacterium]